VKYMDFIETKKLQDIATGLKEVPELNPMLFDFQKDIVQWALKRGRACIFADCGMGKTPMQLEWARHVPGNILIVAPLAVSSQTIREAKKFHEETVEYSPDGKPKTRITITNYERLEKFNPNDYNGIVLDESGILKSYTGKYRTMLIDRFGTTPYKLACTATPAPNDFMELGNHAEFVGAMSRTEMLSMFFIHDGGETQKWRLKKHAAGSEFWEWVCSWAVMIRKPSDLGYEDGKFILPKLNLNQITVHSEIPTEGHLFAMEAQTLQERQKARRTTITARVSTCAEMVNKSKDIWMIWCNLNSESEALRKAIPGSVEVKGSDSEEHKKSSLLGFANGDIRVLISKATIAGFGMNFQVCHNAAFVGLSDSYEQFYQAVRRCWRFGQEEEVNAYIITSDLEGAVVKNIQRKEKDAEKMAIEMVENMHEINEENIKGLERSTTEYNTGYEHGENWEAHLGDTVLIHKEKIADNAIDYTVFSPPFASLYTYSNSEMDMGNSKDRNTFYKQYQYLVKEQYRTLKPGRLLSFHCMNLPTTKSHDGYIGIVDFRGELIRMYQKAGFIYHSEVVIWKNPVVAMQRTKALGLLHKQVVKDSAMSRQGIPDYLVTMRKPGVNENPISGEFDNYVGEDKSGIGRGRYSIDVWQRYASPVWMDIDPSDTLQYRCARDNNDERHICPLQLQVIRRAIQMWSLPGDVVSDPFGGIGSTGHVAVKMERKAIIIELKESYYKQAVINLKATEKEIKEGMLF